MESHAFPVGRGTRLLPCAALRGVGRSGSSIVWAGSAPNPLGAGFAGLAAGSWGIGATYQQTRRRPGALAVFEWLLPVRPTPERCRQGVLSLADAVREHCRAEDPSPVFDQRSEYWINRRYLRKV